MKTKKKLHLFHVGLFLFCFFAFSFHCECIERAEYSRKYSEKAFYSISSLCFHLDELIQEKMGDAWLNEDKIIFNDEEIANLWNGASKDTSFLSQLSKAQQYYYQAREIDNPFLSKPLYVKAKQLLTKIWEKLDSKILKQSANSLTDKDVIPNYNRTMTAAYPHLENNPTIDNKIAKSITPFLIPIDLPIKKSLDEIFEKSRAIKNEKAFEEAGFETLFIQNLHSFIRVARHEDLPGYLLKVYLDSEPNEMARDGWERLANRCEGALNVRELIKSKKMVHFTVPDKWLYVLPVIPSLTSKDQPVLLVVTDMNLVSESKTEEAWKTKVTHQHLDELYCVISHGFASSGLVRNVPYTKNNTFAFIDTEKPKKTPKYDKVKHYLSKEMKGYWDKLVKAGGKSKKKK